MSILLVYIASTRLSIAFVASFFETTWFLWWLIALVIFAKWCWSTYFQDGAAHRASPGGWRSLYQTALREPDNTKAAIRIEEAETAILMELGAQLFARDRNERVELQDAMNNLRSLRDNRSETPDRAQIA